MRKNNNGVVIMQVMEWLRERAKLCKARNSESNDGVKNVIVKMECKSCNTRDCD